MASRNVELVFKARDEASRALEVLNTALADLDAAQKVVASGARPLDKALTGTAKSAGDLAAGLEKVSGEAARKAEKAFKSVEGAVDSARAAFAKQSLDVNEAEAAYAALQAQINAASKAVESMRGRVGPFNDDFQTRLGAAEKQFAALTREAVKLGPAVGGQRRELAETSKELERIESTAAAAQIALRSLESVKLNAARDQLNAAQGRSVVNDTGAAELARAAAFRELAVAQRKSLAADAAIANESAGRGIGVLATKEREIAAASRERAVADRARADALIVLNAAQRASVRNDAALNASEGKARSEAAVAGQIKLATAFRESAAAALAAAPSIQRVLRELLRVGPAADQAAAGLNRGAQGTNRFSAALGEFYGDSRKSLSLMQRIRGEVLSLTATFVGFYGVFQQGVSILTAFTSVEAAQTRLGAAFDQDYAGAGAELAFLRGEADRLGISFDVLSGTYSKYLISAQAAGIETEKVRRSFVQVAEASRVLKLSQADIDGVFNALTQIAGKGTLQMEELRQQLGDRLPGAVGILAQALGYGSDELADFYKAVENGQIGAEDALVALGNGLEATFGGQLDEALGNVTTKIGMLQNLLFERRLTAANSGFIDGLETALAALNAFLASDEGIKFFEALGSAFGDLFELLPVVLDNLDLILIAVKAFAAIKAGQVLGGLLGSFSNLGTASFGARRTLVELQRLLFSFAPSAAVAIRSTGAVGVALRGLQAVALGVISTVRGLLTALGGPIGIAITLLSFFAINSLGGVDEAMSELNDSMADHEKNLQAIQAAYLGAADGASDWRTELEGITALDLQLDVDRLRDGLTTTFSAVTDSLAELRAEIVREEIAVASSIFGSGEGNLPDGTLAKFDALADEFVRGRTTVEGFETGLSALRETLAGVIEPAFLSDVNSTLDAFRDQTIEIAKAEAKLRVFNGTATEADEALIGLTDAVDTNADAVAAHAVAAESMQDKFAELTKLVPELREEMQRLEQVDAIKALVSDITQLAFESNGVADAWEKIVAALSAADVASAGQGFQSLISGLAGAASQILQALQVAGQANDAASLGALSTGAVTPNLLGFFEEQEGFRSQAYLDQGGVPTIGFGHTSAAGGYQVEMGATISRDEAIRIFEQDIAGFAARVDESITVPITEAMRTALISYDYNTGAIVGSEIVALINAGDYAGGQQALRDGINTVDGVANAGLTRRRGVEADLFGSQGLSSAEIAQGQGEREVEAANELAEAAADRATSQEEFVAGQQASIANDQFLLSIQDQDLISREVATALREAEIEAQKVGLTLTTEQRAQIEAVTRAKFQQQALDENRTKALEEAQAKEEAITLLQERRAFLTQQEAYLRASGDVTGAEAAKTGIEEVDAALAEATQTAIDFWTALGGPESVAAIQRLQQTQVEMARVEQSAITTGTAMNEMLAEKATSAFLKMNELIGQGVAPIQAFKTAFLQMASEILIEIGAMIIKQAILNALTGGGSATAGGLGGGLAGFVNGLFLHEGGIVGEATATRSFDSRIFRNAARYHNGGVAGLAPDEIPAVLQVGEEVLKETDPRHRNNIGKGSAGGNSGGSAPNIMNFFDAESFLDAALSGAAGKDMFVNHVSANKSAYRAALGVS